MAGIIGQAIANIGSTFGNYMLQSARDDERDEERREREEQRRREREEDRKWREEQNAMYRRPADQQGAGRSSGARELTDDEQAAAAGMTRPEYDAYWSSIKTGDKSGFKREQQKITATDTGDPYNPEMKSSTVNDYPPGFEAEYRAKVAKLAEIRKMSAFKKDYGNVKKGERTGQQINASNEAIARPDSAGIIGQGMAAGEGKDIVGGDSNVTRNKFTGATTTTKVGDSQIRENDAQAGQAAAAGRKSEADARRVNDRSDPETMRMRADFTQRERTLRTQISKAFGDDKDTLQAQLDALLGERKAFDEQVAAARKSAAGREGPSGSGLPSPKTKAEFDRLPKGTRYKAPDGTIRVK